MAHHDPSEQIAENANAGRIAVGSALALAYLLTAALFGSAVEAGRFALSLAVFVAPGIPVARRWFRGHEALLAGSALGYFASSVVASALARFELLSSVSVLLGSALLYVLSLALSSRIPERPSRESPRGGRVWLAATFVFCLSLAALPFLKVGAHVPEGVAYRAYFSADLMTHLSVVAELQKETYPLENPFYAGDRLGYYWLFFLAPAAFGVSASNQSALLSLYVFSGLLFGGLFFAAAREIGLGPPRAFVATAVALGAVSYEGLFTLGRSWLLGGSFRDINVDAFARWELGLVSLDGLHRGLLYTPQHLFSYGVLVVLLVLVLRGEPTARSSAILAGVLLGAMAGTSIVTAMLAGPWLMLVMLTRAPSFRRFLAPAVWTISIALLLFGVYVCLGFFGDAGGALTLRMPRWPEPLSILLLDAGALFLLVLARPYDGLSRRDLEIAALAALALLAALFLDLEGYEGVWMAWRAGSVLLVALGVLAAPAFEGALSLKRALVIAPAVLTVSLDVFNAQDISNRSVSAGEFRWTTVVSDDEWEALRWIREHTPRDSVVQWDVRAREFGEWAFIPALAERRMAVGSPIFLLDLRKYRLRERREVRRIFASEDATEAHRRAKELGIDYLFIGARELRVRGERLRKLFESKELFKPAFSNDGVTVMEVI
ncbi:MAG: hypothetical protein ACRD3V_15230, partial [Vicinamibacteria bacterium]